MATAQLVDLTNYDSLLVQSTQGRSGTPDGNIFFDVATGEIELITAEELPNVDLGSGSEANPLTNQDGILMAALYAFERQERASDEVLRQYDPYFKGSFKFAGAYELVNGRKFASGDRQKVRGSGWVERSTSGAVDRIYFGVRSLGNIEAASQPFYQLSAGGAPVNFAKPGAIDEAIQVFGTTGNGDAGAGDFDSRTYLAISVRTFGQNYDRKVLADSGITEMAGYGGGFALGESPHLTSGSYALADVYGGAQTATYQNLSLASEDTPLSRTGFTTADGDYSYILANPDGLTLDQCVAYLDAIAQTDDDIDDHASNVINGQRDSVWYSYDSQGRVVTRQGLHIDNLPAADNQGIVQTDDAGTGKVYPFYPEIRVTVGSNAAADGNCWYHAYIFDGAAAQDFNSASAVTLLDSSGSPVKGPVSAATQITFAVDYDAFNQAGLTPGNDFQVMFECEGNGTATQASTVIDVTRSQVISAACEPGLETNL